jgi:hypothetical protein
VDSGELLIEFLGRRRQNKKTLKRKVTYLFFMQLSSPNLHQHHIKKIKSYQQTPQILETQLSPSFLYFSFIQIVDQRKGK